MPYSKENAFTLIELLVVISIISILSVIGMAIYSNARKSANDAKRRADINAISQAYETVHYANGSYTPLNSVDFVNGIPSPPEGGSYHGLISSPSDTGFNICAALEGNPAPTCSSQSATCYCISSRQVDYSAP